MNMHLFNDSLLAFYLLLSIYLLVVKRRVMSSSCFLTLAISMKVPAMLMIPSFLGWI